MNSFDIIIKEFDTSLFVRLNKEKKSGLYDCMRYLFDGGGKRIRPLLAVLTAQTFGGGLSDILPIAIAIELIHTYSLIHDDLPCMDNDDIRRGKPSVHKKYGDGYAVLCGDALLNLAYEVLLEGLKGRGKGYSKGIVEFAHFAGIRGMVGGQCTDISNIELDKEGYIKMYSQKTSALLQAAAVASAYTLYAKPEEVLAVSNYAYYLGIAFQLKDDLIELDEKQDYMEKNLVSYLGKESAIALCEEFTEKSISSIKNLKHNQNLIKLAHTLLRRAR